MHLLRGGLTAAVERFERFLKKLLMPEIGYQFALRPGVAPGAGRLHNLVAQLLDTLSG